MASSIGAAGARVAIARAGRWKNAGVTVLGLPPVARASVASIEAIARAIAASSRAGRVGPAGAARPPA